MNNLNKKAIALAYQNNTPPKVIASGKGDIAQAIIAKAMEFDIPLFASSVLVDSMISLQVDQEVPPQLYSAMVELFIWLEKCDKSAQLSK